MSAEYNEICPVCTLYLRPGITLKSHLDSHPKQKVIEALVNLSTLKTEKNSVTATTSGIAYQPQIINRTVWTQPSASFPNIPVPTANHSFIYQQFMSTSQPPLNQQYITIPTVFNSSLMCSPYVYQQQQQVFMSSAALPSNLVRSKTPSTDLSIRENVYEDKQKENPDLEDEQHNLSIKDVQDDCFNEMSSPLQFEDEETSIDREESIGSPNSDYLRLRQDLNKACQTRQDTENYEEDDENEVTSDNFEFFPNTENVDVVPTNDEVVSLNGMQLVLCNDFIGSQVISQVHDFECNNEQPVLMNIGNHDYNNWDATSNNFQDELSQHSATNLSIRANENMPPRGELSGQESNGAASNITWNRVQYDSNSATSCDLFARETWEGFDGSDCEEGGSLRESPNLPVSEEVDDVPTIISVTEAPLNFKCPTCGVGFKCPKERKTHQTEQHNKATAEKCNKLAINVIGAKVPTKTTVKKLIIKPKKTRDIKKETNFEELFQKQICDGKDNLENKDATLIAETGENKCNIDGEKMNMSSLECSFCGTVHPDMKSLKKHKQFAHPFLDRYKCDTCGEGMKDQKSFTAHLKKHPLECKLCGKYFYRRQNMQLHMKRHLGIKPFVCEFCEKSFFSKQKLFEHRNTHTGEAPIKCKLCDETFRRNSNLVQHRNIHHFNIAKKVKDFICHCGEVLHSKKKLAWHKEIHDTKPKACTKCSEKFIHMASLTRHMRRSHNDRFVPEETRSKENVECPICKNVYLKSSLEAHIRRHSGVKGFSCLICNKEFTTKWNLKLHKWIHASRASKPFKCEHCKAAFIRESDFTAHMNSHKCVRPYTCNHCGAQFIRKSNCQRHVKEHELDKTFACQICGKTFHRSYYLKDHMRVHSGARPYACHICGKTSATKSNHNKHVMIHHAKEPVSTEN